jgi:hypothetical protein
MKAVRWEDTKRQVRELNPDWDDPERVASRERSRAAMRAEQRGHQLAQLRKNTGTSRPSAGRSTSPPGWAAGRSGSHERGAEVCCYRLHGGESMHSHIQP